MSFLKALLNNTLRCMILAGIVFSYGGGSALIQSVAWVTMFADEIGQDASVEEALKNTFDGDAPCLLCHAAKQVQEAEQTEPASKGNENAPVKLATKKLSDCLMHGQAWVPEVKISSCDRGWYFASMMWTEWFLDDVAVPPPELV